jgi:hypothetical protein
MKTVSVESYLTQGGKLVRAGTCRISRTVRADLGIRHLHTMLFSIGSFVKLAYLSRCTVAGV